ncbi:MAG: S41 family peptidase [Clostridiaceae bacterium]|nr:S41 family peptidase [Clostridiaceae bacterium]
MNLNFRTLKTLCVLSLLCLLDISGYGDIGQQGFYGAVEEINERHAVETLCIPHVNIKDYTPAMKAREVGFTAGELDSMTDYGRYKGAASRLTYEQAAEDAELAFRVFKNCYGAYFYFGGDEAFEKAKDQVLLDCERAGENLTVGILQEAFRKNLSFVKDGHFWIGGEPVFTKAVYYSNEETIFMKDEKSYYTEQNGEKRYVSLVDGSGAVEEYMKHSINDEGMLVYRLGILSTEEKKTAEVVFEDGIEKFALLSPKLEIQNIKNNTYYSGYKVDNVSVAEIRSFMDEQSGRQFVGSARTIKNSRVSILDLRGNSGGMSKYVTDWLDIYDPALSEYAGGSIFAYRRSRTADYLRYRSLGAYLSKQEAALLLSGYRIGSNFWETGETQAFERSRSSNILFVLVDSRTFSACEWLIAALRNKDNVIFVGTNSGGGLMGDSAIKIVLPGSRVNIQCGFGLRFYYDETVFSEESGFCPDIWVSTDAMGHTMNLISYYGLEPQTCKGVGKKISDTCYDFDR